MVMIRFLKTVLKMPWPWRMWMVGLSSSNMAALFFFPRIEAIVVFVFLMIGALAQTLLFSKLGFVKLLGIGHIHWLPMIIWILPRLDSIRTEPPFYIWILIMIMFNGISLIIDTVDVIRYGKGERQPTIGS